MAIRTNDRVALITGASRGLGREVARLFAARGMPLILTARGAEPLERAAAELGEQTRVLSLPGDVADPAHAEQLVRLGLERFGRIDVLVNNASAIGPSPMPRLEDLPLDGPPQTFLVNVVAPLRLAQLVLPGMRAHRAGVIVNVTSDAAVQAYPGWGGYGASKAAMEQHTRVLAAELEGSGVRVYLVDPGDMDTEMHRLAEPGVDLSHLPGPDVAAPAFLHLVEVETAPFGRFEAQKGSYARPDRADDASRLAPARRPAVIALERRLDFELQAELEAREPPEARGLPRDGVRLLVTAGDGRVDHARFAELPSFLRPGDLLVANDSATLPSALTAGRADGSSLALHLSARRPGGLWVVEPRLAGPKAAAPIASDEVISLPGGATATLLTPHAGSRRLWLARLDLPLAPLDYLHRWGRPIAYSYVRGQWPLAMYQTVYAREPGSAEMPSAGRAFSPAVLARLAERGVGFATLTLHTGVASLEDHERPYEEPYAVPAATAEAVAAARAGGGRVVAVGTTVVRALESAVDRTGRVAPRRGWTDLVVTPERGVRVVGGLLTGFHEPRATHLAMLEAIAGRPHLERAYAAALAGRYLWHEFGDLHLILP